MRFSMIVAVAANGVIGRDGSLPWHISADLKHFKALTMGKPILMGRRTFDGIGRSLPGRLNVVVTRNAGWSAEAVVVAHSLEEALAAAEASGADEAMVIGGSSLYEAALGRVGTLYLTEVHAEPEGDTIFPALDKTQWAETAREDHPGDGKMPAFSFVTLVRA